MHANATFVGFHVHPLHAASPDNFSMLVYATYWALHSLGNYPTLGFHVVFCQIQGSRFHAWVEVGYLEGSRYVVDGSFDKAEDGKEARSCIDASGKKWNFLWIC